jgi:hypothetical protein
VATRCPASSHRQRHGGQRPAWVRELSAGRAFVLIRGFPVDVLSEAETALAYVGLGLHLGTTVSQNAAGDLLGHVRDTGVARDSPAVRLYATNQRQDFHCDGSDLVGLLCLKTARTGGESQIVSSMAVYNEMLTRRPDLVDVLRQPFAWDRNDEQSPGEDPSFSLPVIFEIDGAPRIFYIGWYIRDAQRHEQAPRLTRGSWRHWNCSKGSPTTRRSTCRWRSGQVTFSFSTTPGSCMLARLISTTTTRPSAGIC